jgi:NAD(P)-dependent dehydrogenase (short-subunit alcohol dehydrogenase family)
MIESNDRFSLKNRTVVITGGAGFLGAQHAEAVAQKGATVVLFDLDGEHAQDISDQIREKYRVESYGIEGNVTDPQSISAMVRRLEKLGNNIDVLINNAAIDSKMTNDKNESNNRLETFSLEQWLSELSVGLTGAFLCSKIIGTRMAAQGRGVIVNVSSDLGIVAPDQRLYHVSGKSTECQIVKPITYSVVKHGLIGLTKYLATYWCESGVRSNTLCPGGVYDGHSEDFVNNLSNLIPMGRMAEIGEYQSAIQFLCSDASSYMNGACLVIDGGRSCW